MNFKWKKLGLLLEPRNDIPWMISHTGSSYVLHKKDNLFNIYLTGRDAKNRSSIGSALFELSSQPKIIEIKKEPILSRGEFGTFDENGVSYPSLVKLKGLIYLYYTGWVPTRIVPFQNQLGLAIINNNKVERFSKAPILERNSDDYISIGGAFVLKEGENWKMWYTSFLKWEKLKNNKFKHRYLIKYATSKNGIHWLRKNKIAINFINSQEYAICRPSVIKINNSYHMFYCIKGEKYKLGYASSFDGSKWTREDSKVGISLSENGWDSEEMCYPHIFKHKNKIYLIYAGNNYGDSGIGIAEMEIK